MEQPPNSDQKPSSGPHPTVPPYLSYPPPPSDSTSGHSSQIPLEGVRMQGYHPESEGPPQHQAALYNQAPEPNQPTSFNQAPQFNQGTPSDYPPAFTQATSLNVPTVDVIPPTPIPPSSAFPSGSSAQPPVELPSHSVHENSATPAYPPRPPRADIPDILPPPPPGPPPAHSTHQRFGNTPDASGFAPPPQYAAFQGFGNTPDASGFAPPPRRHRTPFGKDDDPSNPIHYTRDPHKLVGYLVPFPIPRLSNAPSSSIPTRFLIYTPPPPPLHKPSTDEKEGKFHKIQRKWQEEVRAAKVSKAKATTFAGARSKLTRGVNKAMGYTTTSNLDFLGRVSPSHSKPSSRSPSPSAQPHDTIPPADDSANHKTLGVEEMVLIYPPALTLTPAQMREEFINTMLRTKSKATRDSVIATGLLPISLAIDILAGPIGGLAEINSVWLYASARGAKTARSVTKRLSSSTTEPTETGGLDPNNPTPEIDPHNTKDKLTLTFRPSARLEILRTYLNAECNRVDSKLFPSYKSPPTESDALEAIGWSPHQSGGETRNWEDEQWELAEVKEDLKLVMHKGAKEWRAWCKNYEANPEKNVGK